MKIAASNLQMESSHAELKHRKIRESLRSWSGNAAAPPAAGNTPAEGSRVSLSQAARDLAATDQAGGADRIRDDIEEKVDKDPRTQLIRSVIEFFLGREVELFDRAELEAAMSTRRGQSAESMSRLQSGGAGIEYVRSETYREVEETQFAAEGKVLTADGQEISFKLALSMRREYFESSTQALRIGAEPPRKDPLVLNFDGTAAQLTDQRFGFDLNADGRAESINFVAAGSGFLVFDRNGDGKVNDGRELFGPQTNNGFAELAALDDDRNGWIDEADSAFGRLRLWYQDRNGERRLDTLAAVGVGAISLGHVSTPFELKDAQNQLLGAVRSTGVFLQENGNTGTIQQIDLTA